MRQQPGDHRYGRRCRAARDSTGEWGASIDRQDPRRPYCHAVGTDDAFSLRAISRDVTAARQRFGTTRKTFIGVLRESTPDVQARIIDGVLDKFPVEKFPEEIRGEKQRVRDKLAGVAARLRGGPAVALDDLRVQSEAVARAIADAAVLIRDRGASSGVDRVHTTLHGYLAAVAREHQISVETDASTTDLIKALRYQLPALQNTGPRGQDVSSILKAIGSILGSFDPIRNRASGAHPNEIVLAEPEALLVIDAARTILNYLNRKLRVD